jgi:DNA-binding transcriptional LysR family regulator
MSDLALLRSFIAVYRNGSVSRAAEQMTVAQPTVTSHVRALEAQLGRSLFRRLPRGVAPTPAGRELALAVGHHVDALEGVLYGDVVGRSGRGGVLFIGGPSEFIGAEVLPALAPLVARGMRVRSFLDTNDPVLEKLHDGTLDLAVLTQASDDDALEVESLQVEELVLVAAPARAKRIGQIRQGPGGAERLLDEPMLVYAEELPLVRDYWREVFDTRWVGSPAVVANSLPVVALQVRNDLGIAVLPRHVCEEWIERGEMALVLEPKVPPRNTLYLAWRAGSLGNSAIRSAVELLRGTREHVI